MSNQKFRSCCKDLNDAMTSPPNSFLRVEENGVLYLTIGYAPTAQGTNWFDQTVLFCPFCGSQLQSRDEIRRIAASPEVVN